MPKVRQLDPGGRQSLQPLRTPRSPGPEPTGLDQFAQGLDQAGDELGRIAQAEQEQINEMRAEEARLEFDKRLTSTLFDPDEGYFNRQGKDAYEGAQPTIQQIEEARREVEANLTPQQRELLKPVVERMTQSARQSIFKKASDGKRAWDQSLQEASAENAIEKGALMFNDDEQLRVNLATLRQSTLEAARLEGVGDEMIQERLESVTSKYYATVIGRAMNYDLDRANSLLEQHSDKMEPQDLDEIRQNLAEETNFAMAQKTANDWLSEDLTLSEGLARAREIEDATLQDAVKEQWEKTYKSDQAGKEAAQDRLFESYALRIENGEMTFRDIPRADREAMDASLRKTLRSLEDEVYDGDAPEHSDFETYVKITDLIEQDTRSSRGEARKLLRENLDKLRPEDRRAFAKATAQNRNDDDVESFFTARQRLKSETDDLSLTDDQTQRMNEQFDDWYRRYQVLNDGKKPNDQEIDQTVADLLAREGGFTVPVLGGPFFSDFVFEDEDAGQRVLMDQITADFVERYGRQPTADEMTRLWNIAQRKGAVNAQ